MRRNDLLILIMLILAAPSFAAAAESTPAPPQIKYPVATSPIKYPAPPAANDPHSPKKASLSMIAAEGYDEPGAMPEAASASTSDPAGPQPDACNIQTVLPEAPTPVIMSSSDINRISCGEEIKDALSSTEKGAIIKIVGKDAFLKFSILKSPEGKIKYATAPTEIFVVCGESTYNLVAYPKKVPSKTIRLGSGTNHRIKANQSIFASLPFEKKIIRAIKDVYTEQMPDSYLVTQVSQPVGSYREFSIIHRRSIQIEGEGLAIHEFELALKPGLTEFKLNDKLFVKKIYGSNIVAICPEHHILYPGETTRLFVVEQRNGDSSAGITGIKALEHDEQPLKTEQANGHPAPSVAHQTLAKGEVRHEN
jgi:conjugal transfer pilus assembly protein TraK